MAGFSGMFSPISTMVLAVFIVELEGARDCMDVWYNGYHEGGVFYLGQTRGRAYCEVREFSVAVESSGSGDPGFDASTSTFITVGQNTTNFAGAARSGLHIFIINEHTGDVLDVRRFDTSLESERQSVTSFLGGVNEVRTYTPHMHTLSYAQYFPESFFMISLFLIKYMDFIARESSGIGCT
ncbi:uncharacterized protein LOC144875467 [Branchiostoma floridae x Branchiostoma japonicum]